MAKFGNGIGGTNGHVGVQGTGPKNPREAMPGATGMLKPGAEQLRILEQTFHDHMCSFTVQIHKADSRRSKYAFFIRIMGAVPLGNRTYYFDEHGRMLEARTDHDAKRIGAALKE